jgi:general stress protein YciG
MTEPKTGKANRGFASMDRERQKALASKGGRAAHAAGTAHQWDRAAASAAGRKGGIASSTNREHMAAIGRRGGQARSRNMAEAQAKDDARAEVASL